LRKLGIGVESFERMLERAPRMTGVNVDAQMAQMSCPHCGAIGESVALQRVVEIGAQPRLWGSEWASLPAQRAAFAGRWLSDSSIGQLKRPSVSIPGSVSRIIGVGFGLILSFVAIPALVVALILVISAGVLWFLLLMCAWTAGVALLLAWALRNSRRQTAYQRALSRWSELRYCKRCGTVFSPSRRKIVSVAALQEYLYESP
jgi:hypothetical protein